MFFYEDVVAKQLIMTLQLKKDLIIPFNYNHQLQSAIYAKFREAGGLHIHDSGFGEGREYKSFVFGALMSRRTGVFTSRAPSG